MNLSATRKHLKSLGISQGLTSALIAQRALERGIDIEPDRRGRLSFRARGKRVWFDGARSNLNSPLAKRCALHKDVSSRLLRSYGINAPENVVFGPDDVERAWHWAADELPVVIKPSDGGSGADVHLNITTRQAFYEAFAAVAVSTSNIMIETFQAGVEHRALLVHGKVVAVARRVPAHVVGDGESTVQELVDAKNIARSVLENPVHYEILLDEHTDKELARQNLDLSSVPAEGQRAWLRANSNIHTGGDAVDATDDLTDQEREMAEKVARAIPGLRLAGLDLLLPRDGQGTRACILEINSSPMLSGHYFPWEGEPRDPAGALLDGLFPTAKP